LAIILGESLSIVEINSQGNALRRFLAVAKPTFSVEEFPSSDDIEVFQIEGTKSSCDTNSLEMSCV
jgi:hypothetical protein